MPTDLNEPILEGGLRRIPFFNGRVLTAEDLETEQAANAAERRRLGRALGSGVLEGLFVERGPEASSRTVSVGAGRALGPSGQVIELPTDVELSIVSEIDRADTAGTRGRFADCSARDIVITSGTGPYVLFVEPATGTRGRTPRARLSGDGAAAECGAQYRLEGAALRLVPLDPGDAALVPESVRDPIQERRDQVEDTLEEGEAPASTAVSVLRNLWAHVCLGTPGARTEAADLYDALRGAAQGEGAGRLRPVDVLRRNRPSLSGHAVPLGLLYWARDRILFVDNWSVRRRVHRDPFRPASEAPGAHRPPPATDRRRAEGEAALYQFQDHLASLLGADPEPSALERIEALSFFSFLPAAGLVPIRADEADTIRPPFFRGLTYRPPVFLDGRRVGSLLSRSVLHAGLDLSDQEMLWTYRVRENEQPPRGDRVRYLLFTGPALPFQGDPLYDAARWDYSHYGPGINRHPSIGD
jgi:hypothetical protein